MVRKISKTTTDRFKTVGTIHSPNVVARGVFSKGRSHVLDKLLLFPITRYFLLKFAVLYFKLGKFFFGGFIGFLNYFNLLLDESDSLSKYLVRLNSRKSTNGIFNRRNK
ncbi:hypothetical protein ACU7RR_001198 [Providencia stuartii]|uniref:hypothetical protein n=1 Tax=Providencia TaxID=586 RepID=UPI0023495933|nr:MULTISPECIES: hypothetical protein [Providencia]MDE8745575.1 hypothetical protein [Providencia thailandensis]MDE8764250.1 hypothetical protein [Providencia thailandensis]MDE8776697.1 hypothetical protein [Providencia thailandensis]MDE8780686.1 hypothetical protein [Providencia thailandensis]MDE8784738.1 hypothetical protein [Providencia thailandensis]